MGTESQLPEAMLMWSRRTLGWEEGEARIYRHHMQDKDKDSLTVDMDRRGQGDIAALGFELMAQGVPKFSSLPFSSSNLSRKKIVA